MKDQQKLLEGRKKEMQEQIMESGYSQYVWWDKEKQEVQIDYDAIEKIGDKDTYDKVKELVDKAEDIQGKINDAKDAMVDIQDQLKELEQRYIDEYVDFEQKVLDAVVNQYQTVIDDLTELNTNINDSNASILNSIRDQIDLQRQIRDNTERESEINDLETRLAYLRRDTTGGNEAEIRSIEKQLQDARQNYSDTLIDQSLDKLETENSKAAEQRQKQIEILTAQLEYWQKSGALWEEVKTLIKEGVSPEGWIDFGSTLWSYLQESEDFQSLSEVQQKQWIEELEKLYAGYYAYEQSQEHPVWDEDTDYMNVMARLLQQRGAQALLEPAYQDAALRRLQKFVDLGMGSTEDALAEQQALEDKYLGSGSSDTYKQTLEILQQIAEWIKTGARNAFSNMHFASGGLTTKTGLAWLDGTASEPEYVLNARQTEAFLRLAEVLPAMFANGGVTNTIGGNVYLELTMNVGEIANDYDVDRLVDHVKTKIYEASAYRNLNVINTMR